MLSTSRSPSGFVYLLKELALDKGEKGRRKQGFTLIIHISYPVTAALGFVSSFKSILY